MPSPEIIGYAIASRFVKDQWFIEGGKESEPFPSVRKAMYFLEDSGGYCEDDEEVYIVELHAVKKVSDGY